MTQNRKRFGPLAAIVAGFVTLTLVYCLVTPLFEGPDEIWHFAFADHLASGGGLPEFDADAPVTLLRNGAHPPLYYWLVAALIAPIDRSDFPVEYRFNLANPKVTPGARSSRPNLLVHTAREDFPYRGTALAGHVARLVSIALGALTVVGIRRVAGQMLPDRAPLALAATALAAFGPQFVYGSAMINNDALAAATATWTLYSLGRAVSNGSARWVILSGLLFGATLLAKIGMVAFVPLPALVLMLHAARSPDRGWPGWRSVLWRVALIYVIAFAVAGWWYLRNWSLYGDPLAWREWQVLVGAGRMPPTLPDFARDMLGLFGTFWADFTLRADRALVLVFGALTMVALTGLGRRAVRHDWPLVNVEAWIVGLVWLGLLLASAVRYSFAVYDIHGRLLFPALATIGPLLALGLSGWNGRAGRRLIYGACAVLLAIAAIAPFSIIQPAYARPILSQLPGDTIRSSARFGDAELVGYRWKRDRVNVGEPVELTTYWQSVRTVDPSSRLSALHATVTLMHPSGALLGHADVVLGTDAYPSWAWQPDEIVATEIAVSTKIDGPAVADVRLGVRGEAGMLAVGRVAFRPDRPCAEGTAAQAAFGGVMRLVGYRIDAATPGTPGKVVLCWESIRPTPIDYTVFVHVVDAGQFIAADSQPRGGDYPTSAWESGEQIEDAHPLPPDAAPQQVTIGVYRLDTGERLTIDGTAETEYRLETR